MSSAPTPFYKTIYVKIIATVLVLYCLIWLFSPTLVKYFAKEPLAKMGLILAPESSIRLNPFLTRLTVTNLTLQKDNKTVFSTKNLALQIALHKILFDEVEIEELTIDGITVEVEKNADKLFVAGVNLSTNEEVEKVKEKPEEATKPLPYNIILSAFKLTNVNVNVLIDQNPHTAIISEFLINNIEASQIKQKANVQLKSTVDNAPLNVNASVNLDNGNGVIESDIDISRFPLADIKHLIEPLNTLSGNISFTSKQTITVENENIAILITDAELLNSQLQLTTQQESVTSDELSLNIKDLALSIIDKKIDVTIKETQLNNNNLIASADKNTIKHDVLTLNLNDLSLSIIDENIDVSIKSTHLNNNNLNAISGENTLRHEGLELILSNTSLTQLKNKNINLSIIKTQLNNKPLFITSNNNTIQHDALTLNLNDLALSLINDDVNVSVASTKAYNKNLSINADNNKINNNEFTLTVNKLLLTLLNNKLNVDTQNTKLLNKGLTVKTEKNTVNLEELALNTSDLGLVTLNSQLNNIKGNTQITLNNAGVLGATDNEKILSFSRLNISNLQPSIVKIIENQNRPSLPKATIDTLTISDLEFSENKTTDLPAIAKIKEIIVKDIDGDSSSVSVNSIDINSITSHLILSKEKVLANLVNLTPDATQTNEETELKTQPNTIVKTEELEVSDPFIFSINEFNMINNNEIYFIDNSVSPPYKRSIMIDKLAVKSLSNHPEKTEEKTTIELLGRSNKYANFDMKGYIKPFANQKTYHVKGKLNELSLPDVSTYMKNALQLELTSGQLDSNIEMTLVDDDINGKVSFNIAGLETGSVDEYQTNVIKQQVRIPLNAALGMLKDSKGNLKLNIPLSGKTSSPSFGINSFIALITKKAVMSATESYLMKTFVPYSNVVSAAMVAGEFILRLRFEDLIFAPEQANLNETQTEYIEQFIALMKDKKNTQVKVCSISTPSDIGLTPDTELTQDDVTKIKEIGIQRGNDFKAKAVEAGIKSSRMLVCSPQIDKSPKAVPRLTIAV